MRQFELTYLQGLATNQRISKSLWVDPKALEDRTAKEVMSVLLDLRAHGSVMTPEVVEARLSPLLGTDAAQAFVAAAIKRKVTPAQVREFYAQIVEKHVRQESLRNLEYTMKHIDDADAIDRALHEIRKLKAMQPSRGVSLGSQSARTVEETFNAHHYIIPWSLRTMRQFMVGLTRQECAVVAGRPGTGKTSFATFNADEFVKAGLKTMYFSKEMPASRLIQKILVKNCDGVTASKVRTGNLTEAEKEAWVKTTNQFVATCSDNLLIFDDVYSVAEMETLIAKHRPDVVIDDYIQLTQLSSRDRVDGIREVIDAYKHMAKEYDIAFMVLAQMNRNSESREDHRPRMSDLAESGAIEQYACDIMFLHYEYRFDRNSPKNEIEIINEKARYGNIQGVVQGWDGDNMTYFDFPVGAVDPDALPEMDEGNE